MWPEGLRADEERRLGPGVGRRPSGSRNQMIPRFPPLADQVKECWGVSQELLWCLVRYIWLTLDYFRVLGVRAQFGFLRVKWLEFHAFTTSPPHPRPSTRALNYEKNVESGKQNGRLMKWSGLHIVSLLIHETEKDNVQGCQSYLSCLPTVL